MHPSATPGTATVRPGAHRPSPLGSTPAQGPGRPGNGRTACGCSRRPPQPTTVPRTHRKSLPYDVHTVTADGSWCAASPADASQRQSWLGGDRLGALTDGTATIVGEDRRWPAVGLYEVTAEPRVPLACRLRAVAEHR